MGCLCCCGSVRTLMKEISICSNAAFPFSAAKSCYKYIPSSMFIGAKLGAGVAWRPPAATGDAGSAQEETCTSFQEATPKAAVAARFLLEFIASLQMGSYWNITSLKYGG